VEDGAAPAARAPAPARKRRGAGAILAAIFAAAALALICVTGLTRAPGAISSASNWLSLGQKYLLDLEYEQSVVAFTKAIEIDPRSVEPRLGLAQALMALERYDEAEEALLEVLDIDDMNASAYIALQDLYDAVSDMAKLRALLDDMRERGLEAHIMFGEVTGRVIDGGTMFTAGEQPLGSVAVAIAPDSGGTVRETSTGADGMYSALCRGGDYTQTLEAEGYISAQRTFTVYRNEITYMPALIMIPSSGGEGYVSGRIIDALTGWGVPYAEIALYNAQLGSFDTFTADSQGDFEFALPAGYYSADVSAEGYTGATGMLSAFGGQSLYNQNLTLTPYLNEGEARAVLTWGQYPMDLDSHLIGPRADGNRFHIYFENKTEYENGTRMADLDLDDINSYGPETTSIYVATPGVYSFVVHDYTNGGVSYSTALANSGATVRVYVGGSQIREFSVPPGLIGDTWYVFDLVDGQLSMPETDTYQLSAW
jgi:hypothetical protein